MHFIVTIHLLVGILTVIAALTLVWRRPGRRITLYVLTLQILLGVYLMSLRLVVSPVHIISAVVAWGLLMAANAIERRNSGSKLVLGLSAAAALLILAAGAIGGMIAAHAAHGAA